MNKFEFVFAMMMSIKEQIFLERDINKNAKNNIFRIEYFK